MTDGEVLKSTAEVALQISASSKTVTRMAKRKGVRPLRLGRELRWTQVMVAALVADDTVPAPAPDK